MPHRRQLRSVHSRSVHSRSVLGKGFIPENPAIRRDSKINLPQVISDGEWQAAHEALLVKEKEATRARDALAAERRRLPRVHIGKDYVFGGPEGKATLLDLFEGRRQLLLYHFMFGPNQDVGCDGCSMFVDQIGNLAHLQRADAAPTGLLNAAIWKSIKGTRSQLPRPVNASH